MLPLARLAARAQRKGIIQEPDCDALPRLSQPAQAVITRAEQLWEAERGKHGEEAQVRTVALTVVRKPLLLCVVCLTFRGCGNAFVLPLLLSYIVEAVMQGDISSATRFLGFLVLERVVGACLEYQGFKLAMTRIPTDLTVAVAGLVTKKAAAPGLMGLQTAGVDPAALVGREFNVLHAKLSSMLPNGLISLPTLVAGCSSLFFLLGWPAVFGVTWILLTIRIGIHVQEYSKLAEGRMAKIATERLNILSNVVSAVKAIKYFAWEPEFQEQLLGARAAECECLRARARWSALAIGIGKLTPVTASLATFVAYALIGNEIRAATIFAANSVFMTLRFSVGAISFLSETWKTTMLTLSRVDKLLGLPERPPRFAQPDNAASLAEISNLRVSFADAASPKLEAEKAFELVAEGTLALGCRGKLTAICGAVGSGKSVLLNALLGHVDGDASFSGTVRSVADAGWCPQKAFVISGTIEENILLGRPVDKYRLERCLADACLGMDLEQLSQGLQEVVGERGTTLSGGQQARLGLARAYYGDPSLLVLDDPFAAVDAAVGRAMMQALRLRCAGENADWGSQPAGCPGAIVVLNQLPLLPNFDQVVFVKDGCIVDVGTFGKLRSNPEFRDFMRDIELQERPLDAKQDLDFARDERLRVARCIDASSSLCTKSTSATATTQKSIIQKETTASGFVRWAVWRSYLFAPGKPFFFFLVCVYIAMYITLGGRDWWMSVWADDEGGGASFYISVFVLLNLSHVAVVIFSVVIIGTFAAMAGRNLHTDCVSHLLRAPMSYFDSTPSGRISSRLGPDLAMVDSQMALMIDVSFTFSFMAIMMTATVMAKIPIMAAVFAAAFACTYPVFKGLAILRQDIKRYSNNAVAPILSNLSDIRRGAVLASVFGCKDFFLARHLLHTDKWTMLANGSTFTQPLAQAWCHLMHVFLLTATGILTFVQADTLMESPGLIAMYFSYAALWGLFAMVTMFAAMNLLTNGASLERLVEFKLGDLPQEPAWSLVEDPAPKAWPTKGALCFDKVALRYRPGLPLALDGFDLDVAGGEKIGIVGRTGAGKSSITSVLFRLVECERGRVTIDGVDIAGLGLHTLRKAISMIPQEPIVMSGTVRYNLDPFGRHGDDELLAALRTAGLVPAVSLETPASGAGAGLSAGQKQLLTFGRTLLQDTRVVMMDEPTASVDMQTDRLVQRMSREAFADRTVLTIAHRLDTVRLCDRLAVMDAGRLVELGPPGALLADGGSRLARLVAAEGGGHGGGRTPSAILGRLGQRLCEPCRPAPRE